MNIPSSARTGKHRFTLNFSYQGMQDRRELHFFVKNSGGWDKDPDADALRQKFPGATVAILQQGLPAKELGLSAYAGCTDTMIMSTHEVGDRNSDWINYGGAEFLQVGQYGLTTRALVRFDLSALPKGARLEAAFLKAYMFQGTGARNGESHPQQKFAYRILRPWGGGTGIGDLFDKKRGAIRDGECSWKEARRPEPWGAAGCDKPGVDREAEPVAASRCDAQPSDAKGNLQPVKKVWVKWDLTAPAKEWMAAPERNFGVLLAIKDPKGVNYYTNEGRGRDQCEFRSSEFEDPVCRPKMIVVYRK